MNLFLQFLFIRLTLSVVSAPEHAEFNRVTAWGFLAALPLSGWTFTSRFVPRHPKVLWVWRHPTLFAEVKR